MQIIRNNRLASCWLAVKESDFTKLRPYFKLNQRRFKIRDALNVQYRCFELILETVGLETPAFLYTVLD